MFGNKEMVRGAMYRAEQDSRKKKCRNAGSKNEREAFCRGPQVVGPPSHGLRSVLVNHETGEQPNGEDQPRKEVDSLELPDIPGHKSAENKNLHENYRPKRGWSHRMASALAVLRPGC